MSIWKRLNPLRFWDNKQLTKNLCADITALENRKYQIKGEINRLVSRVYSLKIDVADKSAEAVLLQDELDKLKAACSMTEEQLLDSEVRLGKHVLDGIGKRDTEEVIFLTADEHKALWEFLSSRSDEPIDKEKIKVNGVKVITRG